MADIAPFPRNRISPPNREPEPSWREALGRSLRADREEQAVAWSIPSLSDSILSTDLGGRRFARHGPELDGWHAGNGTGAFTPAEQNVGS